LPETGAPDDVYEAMAREFDPPEQVALTLAIVAINGWNRFSVALPAAGRPLRLAPPSLAGYRQDIVSMRTAMTSFPSSA